MNKNRKLKILFTIGRLSVGGAEKLLVKQLPVVSKEKFDPYLLTLFSEQKDSFVSEIILNSDHWKKLDFRSLFDPISWFRVFNFLRKEKFDAVITSLFSANLIVRILAILLRIPVIISYEHNLYPNKHRWQILMDWLLAKWTDKIIVDSEAVRQFTAKQENIPIDKFLLMHIPPLLDMIGARNPDLVRKELGLPPSAKIILTVSRLVEEKGHRYLVDAAKKVLEEIPVFVQDGKTGFLVNPKDSDSLAKKITQLLKDRVLRQKFGKTAEQTVQRYSLEEYEKNFEDLVLKIYQSKPSNFD